ncbi:MAG: metalloregulator ArsR/SmtB family transcription factor [Phycisphaerae bacterium]|nr:metalloregulator ArsR/SmtB family transcription factor [Phycisphaerae bacterium]
MSKRRPATPKCCSDLTAAINPRFFKALCDPTRVAILVRLATCGRPCTVSEVANGCPIDVSVVSRHLAQLRDAGMAAGERRGKEVYYAVRFSAIASTLRHLADAIDACCPPTWSKPKRN